TPPFMLIEHHIDKTRRYKDAIVAKNAAWMKSAKHLSRAESRCVHVVENKKVAGLKRCEE
ncbi:hypothetical protein, partial [Pectobacterium brasiliense]|uniref:hypothetical protein n=1 Tax=Pectobacterium brasiliense TaxID=180957 RepID=UPI00196905C9